jgi:hypothetical protein
MPSPAGRPGEPAAAHRGDKHRSLQVKTPPPRVLTSFLGTVVECRITEDTQGMGELEVPQNLPEIGDGSGYFLSESDTRFLGLTIPQIQATFNRVSPLGMGNAQYHDFERQLKIAIRQDGLDSVDVRIQGSSVRFFSGPHKSMPFDRTEIVKLLEACDRAPSRQELDDLLTKIEQLWPGERPRPKRRPFDAMFTLGLDRARSDYDMQVSSDEIVARARELVSSWDVDEGQIFVNHPKYQFVQKRIVFRVCPNLTKWAELQRRSLGRDVTVAAFGSTGPEVNENGGLSSHFKEDDWVVFSNTGKSVKNGAA